MEPARAEVVRVIRMHGSPCGICGKPAKAIHVYAKAQYTAIVHEGADEMCPGPRNAELTPVRQQRMPLGDGIWCEWISWDGVTRVGLTLHHFNPDGARCKSRVMFNLPVVRRACPDKILWSVDEWMPLTLGQALVCSVCRFTGRIKTGLWVSGS